MVRARCRFASRGSAGHARRDHRLAASRPARRQDGDDRRRRRAAAPRAFKRELLRQQVKSMLSVPIFQAGRLRACLALDAVQAPRAWRDDEAALLDLCARLIGAARYQSQAPARDVADRGAKAPLLYLDTGRAGSGACRCGPSSRSGRCATRRVSGSTTAAWSSTGVRCISGARCRRHHFQHSSHGHRQPVSCRRAGQARRRGFSLAAARGVAEPWPVSRPHHRTLTDRLGW